MITIPYVEFLWCYDSLLALWNSNWWEMGWQHLWKDHGKATTSNFEAGYAIQSSYPFAFIYQNKPFWHAEELALWLSGKDLYRVHHHAVTTSAWFWPPLPKAWPALGFAGSNPSSRSSCSGGLSISWLQMVLEKWRVRLRERWPSALHQRIDTLPLTLFFWFSRNWNHIMELNLNPVHQEVRIRRAWINLRCHYQHYHYHCCNTDHHWHIHQKGIWSGSKLKFLKREFRGLIGVSLSAWKAALGKNAYLLLQCLLSWKRWQPHGQDPVSKTPNHASTCQRTPWPDPLPGAVR